MRRIAIAFLIMAALLSAQRPARRPPARTPAPASQTPAPTRWPLASIRVTGNEIISTDAVIRETGLKPGQPVNASDFEKAVARLTETGVFETITFRYEPAGDRIAVTFEVQEVIDFYPVGFRRLDVPEPELMKLLGEKVPLFGPKIPATGRMVSLITSVLEERTGRKILGRLQPASDGKLVMTFYPAEQLPNITFVKFQGSAVLRDVDLQAAFYQTAVGVPYTPERLTELLDANIRPLFEEKGRLRVRFGPFQVDESKEPEGVHITVPVEDGEEFVFGVVKFAGHTRIPEKDLSRLARLEEGEMANFAAVKRTVADVERLYKRNGFMNVKVTVDRTVDEEKKSVDLTIHIREGDQYRFRNLTIKGLNIVGEAAVKRRWGIKRGDPFDGSYPELFLRTIEQERMFEDLEKTSHRVTVDEEAKMADVELTFLAPRKTAPGRVGPQP